MPYQRPLRLPSVMASILAATGIVLAVASCTGHITPLGPDQAATIPQPHHLRSPLILQDMRTQGLAGRVAQPVPYGLVITVPAADLAALKAVTTTAADAHGYLSISVADRTWLLPRVLRPFPSPHFEIVFPSRNQARQLQRMLVPAG